MWSQDPVFNSGKMWSIETLEYLHRSLLFQPCWSMILPSLYRLMLRTEPSAEVFSLPLYSLFFISVDNIPSYARGSFNHSWWIWFKLPFCSTKFSTSASRLYDGGWRWATSDLAWMLSTLWMWAYPKLSGLKKVVSEFYTDEKIFIRELVQYISKVVKTWIR